MVDNENRLELPAIQGLNADFFEKSGHPDDPESFLYNSKLLTVRHA